MEHKVLGKGLSALIPQSVEKNIKNESISSLEIDLIKNNSFQPRKNYDESKLESLKSSIKEKGVLQPILVRQSGNGYEVIAGERRLRAAKALNFQKVPVIVKNVTDREALVLALVENIQREELNDIEEAQGLKRLIEEFNFTHESVAQSVGRDRVTVTNLLRLLKLPQDIQDYVVHGKISGGHARALLGLPDAMSQKKMADEVVSKGLSVRRVEALIKMVIENTPGNQKNKAVESRTRDIQIVEEEISRVLGTKTVVQDKGNKGKIIIEYYSLDDFDRILGVIRR